MDDRSASIAAAIVAVSALVARRLNIRSIAALWEGCASERASNRSRSARIPTVTASTSASADARSISTSRIAEADRGRGRDFAGDA